MRRVVKNFLGADVIRCDIQAPDISFYWVFVVCANEVFDHQATAAEANLLASTRLSAPIKVG